MVQTQIITEKSIITVGNGRETLQRDDGRLQKSTSFVNCGSYVSSLDMALVAMHIIAGNTEKLVICRRAQRDNAIAQPSTQRTQKLAFRQTEKRGAFEISSWQVHQTFAILLDAMRMHKVATSHDMKVAIRGQMRQLT